MAGAQRVSACLVVIWTRLQSIVSLGIITTATFLCAPEEQPEGFYAFTPLELRVAVTL